MKPKHNVILQYTLVSLFCALVVSLALSFALTRWTKDHLVRMHIELFDEIVQNNVRHHDEIISFFQAGPVTVPPEAIKHFISELTQFGAVFRIKLWGRNAVILWSDETEIIGRRYPDNEEYWTAWSGRIAHAVTLPNKSEQVTEKNRGVVLEIYTPLKKDNQVYGVVELYEASEELWIEINRHMRLIWYLVGLAGVILYLLLFYIFYNAQKKVSDTQGRLIETQDVTIYALAYQAGLRDLETGRHLDRTAKYVELIARELKKSRPYRKYLSEDYIRDLVRAAPLHDIGKVGVPDSILLKPGRLTPEETLIMRRHVEYGAKVLQQAQDKLPFQSFLSLGQQIALFHHEKWDGGGYPQGLKQEEIPLSARIMALADVYDALRSKRPYKEPFDHDRCREIIASEKGRHFDPAVVEAFLVLEKEFERISIEWADQPEAEPEPVAVAAA
ncbi:MAG: HD domain-containing phosphohydrolase [Thermodesulfobacteriota bacterium]